MKHSCEVSVVKPWLVPLFLFLWLGGTCLYYYLLIDITFADSGWLPELYQPPAWLFITAIFGGLIGILIGAGIISKRLPKKQMVQLDENG